ncbi:hypothetical protein [Algoriphagus litoralis]|uniref:hypothetical protein n=1 Tax=Algoriphagus litoralis TaxID=2202829 RepID=UPI000DBAD469|nr:hypothetical protein [Algoriphagus litoralis]
MIRFALPFLLLGLCSTALANLHPQSPKNQKDSLAINSLPLPEELLPEITRIAVPESWVERYPAELIGLQLGMKRKFGKAISLRGLAEDQSNPISEVLVIGPKNDLDSMILAGLSPSASRLSILNHPVDLDSGEIKPVRKLYLETTENPDFQALYRVLGLPSMPTAGSATVYAYDWLDTYSLAYMNFPDLHLIGEKLQVHSVNIPTYLSKAKLKSLSVHFRASHSSIPKGNRRFLNFYLNNNLLRTFQLTANNGVDELFEIPPIVLAPGSYFTFELLPADFSGPGSKDFDLEIDLENTLISPEYRSEFPLLFSSFPKNMEGKPLEIRYDFTLRLAELEALGNLLDILNQRPQKEYPLYFPKMTRINGPEELPMGDTHLILLTQSPEQYEEVFKNLKKIAYSPEGLSHKSDEIGLFLKNHPQTPLTWMELFARDGQHVLLISNDLQDGRPLVEAIDGIEDYYVTDMGNILVADASHYYYFDIRLKELKSQRVENRESFESFWMGYRLYLSAFLLILIVVLLLYVYQKSQTAKKKIEDART